MRYLTTKNLKPGLIAGKPILNERGIPLLNANGVITRRLIDMIIDLGLQGCYVTDEVSKDIVINDLLTTELKSFTMAALRHKDVNDLIGCAKLIIESVSNVNIRETSLIEVKDLTNYTLQHSVATAVFATILGKAYKLSDADLLNLCLAALLMDVGKLNMLDTDVNLYQMYHSNEFYNDDAIEREIIRKHAKRSYEIVQEDNMLSSITKNAILFSHEYLDGSGYYGYSGMEIKTLPRILRIAEIYDAMTSDRKWRKAYSPAETIEYLMAEAAVGKLDLNICMLLKTVIPAYGIGMTVKLNTGEEAVVTALDNSMLRPTVKLLDSGKEINLLYNLNVTIIDIL